MSKHIARKGRWSQPGFVAVATVLTLAAVALNVVLAKGGFNITPKKQVPLVKSLETIPATLGDWTQVSKDEPISPAIEDSLGTKMYIFRDYVNTKAFGAAELAQFDGKSALERRQYCAYLQQQHPEAVINMAVTYYTGGADTVAHVPERCYVADGYVPKSSDTLSLKLGAGNLGPAKPDGDVDVRYIHFQDTNGLTKRVAYFFFANGQYENSSDAVRVLLQDFRNRYGFYAKVELMSVAEDEPARQAMGAFLSSAMPEVSKCFADFKGTEAGGKK